MCGRCRACLQKRAFELTDESSYFQQTGSRVHNIVASYYLGIVFLVVLPLGEEVSVMRMGISALRARMTVRASMFRFFFFFGGFAKANEVHECKAATRGSSAQQISCWTVESLLCSYLCYHASFCKRLQFLIELKQH